MVFHLGPVFFCACHLWAEPRAFICFSHVQSIGGIHRGDTYTSSVVYSLQVHQLVVTCPFCLLWLMFLSVYPPWSPCISTLLPKTDLIQQQHNFLVAGRFCKIHCITLQKDSLYVPTSHYLVCLCTVKAVKIVLLYPLSLLSGPLPHAGPLTASLRTTLRQTDICQSFYIEESSVWSKNQSIEMLVSLWRKSWFLSTALFSEVLFPVLVSGFWLCGELNWA